ncbi:MAG: cytochrome c [Saprospiraceae bacterium]|nr:cytochrome c [Saprospiraceae bacterium]
MFAGLKKSAILTCIASVVIFASFTFVDKNISTKENIYISDSDSVWDIYEKLGKIKINRVNTSIEGVSIEKGRNLVLTGISTKKNGKGKTSPQSPYFKCISCHNTKKEFDDLSDISAQKRLDYAEKNDLPYLQGTSFYGIINRVTFYNDDYQKKYGHIPIIKASNTDIRQAIQLCATQCAQGRALEDWEIESVLAYFWSLELKIKDLKLNISDKTKIETAINNNKNNSEAIHLIDAKFWDKSPAHFAEERAYKAMDKSSLENVVRFKNGKLIYDRSCLYCHKNQRFSFFNLDHSTFSFVNLMFRTKKAGMGSIHKITRHGTWPLAGNRAYMPLYPLEKLSEDQLDDLRIYIENMSKGNNLIANSR